MHYYERHLGDYAKDTIHLSLLEHGVYSMLLDRYYGTEQPIPHNQAYRLAGARTNEEQAAVDVVLEEFFENTTDGWRHARCDAEIARFHEKQGKAKASAMARWSNAKRPECERNTNAMRTYSEGNANQAPITNNQEEAKAKADATSARGSRLPDDWTLPDEWAQWARAERPDIDPNAEAAKFADHFHSAPGQHGRKTRWQATWRNWVRNARPSQQARGSPARASVKPSAAADFRGTTYESTPDDQLPVGLR